MSRLLLASAVLGLVLAGPVPPGTSQSVSTFAVTLTRGPAWLPDRTPNDQPLMRVHSANMRRLRREGHILIGGRYGPFGLVLITAPDSATVAGMFLPDSAVQTGVFDIRIDRWGTFYDGCVE